MIPNNYAFFWFHNNRETAYLNMTSNLPIGFEINFPTSLHSVNAPRTTRKVISVKRGPTQMVGGRMGNLELNSFRMSGRQFIMSIRWNESNWAKKTGASTSHWRRSLGWKIFGRINEILVKNENIYWKILPPWKSFFSFNWSSGRWL